MKWIDAPIGFAPGTSKKISRIKREKLEARRSGKKCNSVQRAESDKVLALDSEKKSPIRNYLQDVMMADLLMKGAARSLMVI